MTPEGFTPTNTDAFSEMHKKQQETKRNNEGRLFAFGLNTAQVEMLKSNPAVDIEVMANTFEMLKEDGNQNQIDKGLGYIRELEDISKLTPSEDTRKRVKEISKKLMNL